MKNTLKLENLGLFILSIYLFVNLDYGWWSFLACLFLPDLSMIGYAFNPKIGAYLYNIAHHQLLAVIILILGYITNSGTVEFIGIILLAHSSMDRCLGYGLKYTKGFKYTHLGVISFKKN